MLRVIQHPADDLLAEPAGSQAGPEGSPTIAQGHDLSRRTFALFIHQLNGEPWQGCVTD
jgi:hypothetical protein